MIHHISIAAENPLNVANVLAEIWNGKVYPTPPIPGGYIMMSFDAQGTAIEIYPQGATITPVNERPEIGYDEHPSTYASFYALISVPTDASRTEQIAQRAGWQVRVGEGGAKLF